MKAYKGFERDMTCRGFQFEEGKTYETDKAELCRSGFHACEDPMDCLRYYPPADSVYHEVELDGVSDERQIDDSKVCAKKITIGAALDFEGLANAKLAFNLERATGKKTSGDRGASTSGDRGASTSGNRGASTSGDWGASTSGYRGASTSGNMGASTSGYRGASTSGDWGAATSGDWGASTSGDWGASTSGDRGASTSGYRGASTSGDWGAALSGGKVSVGRNGVAVARGVEHDALRVRGGMGALLVIVHEDEDGETLAQCSGLVDGEKIKPDTWYKLQDGAFVEAREDA